MGIDAHLNTHTCTLLYGDTCTVYKKTAMLELFNIYINSLIAKENAIGSVENISHFGSMLQL